MLKAASLFVSQGEEAEEEESGQKGGAVRRGSYLEYDMGGMVEEKNSTIDETMKNKQTSDKAPDNFINSSQS